MKYYITYAIDARSTIEVDANDLDTAIFMARAHLDTDELGDMHELQYEEMSIEDGNGNLLYEA